MKISEQKLRDIIKNVIQELYGRPMDPRTLPNPNRLFDIQQHSTLIFEGILVEDIQQYIYELSDIKNTQAEPYQLQINEGEVELYGKNGKNYITKLYGINIKQLLNEIYPLVKSGRIKYEIT